MLYKISFVDYNPLHLRYYYTKLKLKKVDIHIDLYYISIFFLLMKTKIYFTQIYLFALL